MAKNKRASKRGKRPVRREVASRKKSPQEGKLAAVDVTELSDAELDRLARNWRQEGLSTSEFERIAGEIGRRVGPPETTALLEAIRAGDAKQVQSLIAEGAEVDEMDACAETPMSVAAALGSLELVKILHGAGAPLGYGFIDAVNKGHLAIVRWMLDHGMRESINDPTSEEEQTVLFGAAANGDLKMVRLLVENGADVNHKDRDGDRAVDSALALDRHEAVELLEALSKNSNR
jgi:ankyrin repeat protein